ncbi:hypothetical protein [Pseudarthrobacter sp. BIM B-2242]|uniref:hypothetical protein n=1 Tax=Pseudarthrobacter sp. BIM B-2242 TaxID=2772401 RepID=UPI00168BD2AB|nr:hypothetical protein [Pseudarthrobacter sp. BIM B-2242]QOD06115.1 hypothetical protein IDT60_21380 [Pseudarthrobacter sp. BIM B-2242]
MSQGHQPGGQPNGGQFMTTTHAEPTLALGAPAPFLHIGEMANLDSVEQQLVSSRMDQLRQAGVTGRATDFETTDGFGTLFYLKNRDGEFSVHLSDHMFGVMRGVRNQTDRNHESAADVDIHTKDGSPVPAEEISAAYSKAMAKARTVTRWAQRSGLRSRGNVSFGLPELRKDEWDRPVGSLDITMDVGQEPVTYTVLMPRCKDKVEAYTQDGKPLTPRMTEALLQEATEEGGGPAGTDMIGNAIAVTLLEEGETW